jgi:hypothetical protein
MNQSQPLPAPRRAPGLFWPIILIGLGVILLLSNLGRLPADPWPLIWRLWPVILIVIGLDILLGRRSVWGGMFSAALALFLIGGVVALLYIARNYPTWYYINVPGYNINVPASYTQHISHPLGDVSQAQVRIDFPGGLGTLSALEDSSNLIEGDVSYPGQLVDLFSTSGSSARVQLGSRFFGWGLMWSGASSRRWTLGLNPRVEYDLTLDTGSGSYELDLRKLTLRSFALDSGSGHMVLTLPDAEKAPRRFRLNTGSGAVDIRAPEGAALRVEYDGGSGALIAPGLHKVGGGRRDGVYESAGFSLGGQYIVIELDGGSGSVTIR